VAVFVAQDFKTTLNGTNLSAYLTQTEIQFEVGDVETTAFGSTWRTRVAGLKTGTVNLQFNQDFGAAAVDATIWPLLGTIGTVVISPTSTAISATNPAYTATVLINAYSVNGVIGDLSVTQVTWPISGTVTRATA
jgi:hypothetical protein